MQFTEETQKLPSIFTWTPSNLPMRRYGSWLHAAGAMEVGLENGWMMRMAGRRWRERRTTD
jgi:hypothetical protein